VHITCLSKSAYFFNQPYDGDVLMGNPFKKPKAPPPPPPPKAPVPLPDLEQQKRTQRRTAATRARGSGRTSTVLTNENGKLGGG